MADMATICSAGQAAGEGTVWTNEAESSDCAEHVSTSVLADDGLPFGATREDSLDVEARRQAGAHEGAAFSSVDDLMRDLLDA